MVDRQSPKSYFTLVDMSNHRSGLCKVRQLKLGDMGKKRRQASEDAAEDTARESSGTNDLYTVLGVDRSATHGEIRKAYHKLALRLHPDKNSGDVSSKEKFQSLQSVIAILEDPEKRKIYDETGSVEDVELSGDSLQNVYQFFRALYKQVGFYRNYNNIEHANKIVTYKYVENMECR